MFAAPTQTKRRKPISINQVSYPLGYISTQSDSRIPIKGLADMTNMVLEQDGIPRPRPPLVLYGNELVGDTSIGFGTFTKIVSGFPERWEISMQTVSGEGKICVRKDGENWTNVGGTYDDEALVNFCQGNNRVYVNNGVDTMSYYDINAESIVTYTAILNPSAPTPAKTGLTGTSFTLYYKIAANNAVGTTAASAAGTITVGKLRDSWTPGDDFVDLTWSAVTGATSYNIYVGSAAGQENLLTSVGDVLAWRDEGNLATDPFTQFPPGNSTAGPKLTQMWNKSGQLFGVGDPDNPYYLWYSGTGLSSGDFSPFNGGGYLGIDYGGDTVPVAVRAFRDGKGNPAMTILSKGPAGRGKLTHALGQSTTIGETIITYFETYESNTQSGTVAPRAVLEINNSLEYFTGDSVKSTGTSQSVFNILNTNSISQAIENDIRNLNLEAMDGAAGVEYEGRAYYALPYGSTENNQIWIHDLTRKGLWILRWDVAAKFLWLYEDNDGRTHFCAFVDDQVMEFDFNRTNPTQDNGSPFRTRLASGSMVWDEAGISMASIQKQRFKFLYPQGTIRVSVFGLARRGEVTAIGTDTFSVSISFTGWGVWDYSGDYDYDNDYGPIESYASSVRVLPVTVNKIVNELKWEVITDEVNCDYLLSSVHTDGKAIPKLFYGD